MSDGGDLGLGNEDFFGDDDGSDLNRIFDEDDDAPPSLGKSQGPVKNPESTSNEDDHSHSSNNERNNNDLDPETPLDVSSGDNVADVDGKTDTGEGTDSKEEDEVGDDGAEEGEGKLKKKTRRRSSNSVEGDRSGPPPAWHSEAADKPHREVMIQEM